MRRSRHRSGHLTDLHRVLRPSDQRADPLSRLRASSYDCSRCAVPRRRLPLDQVQPVTLSRARKHNNTTRLGGALLRLESIRCRIHVYKKLFTPCDWLTVTNLRRAEIDADKDSTLTSSIVTRPVSKQTRRDKSGTMRRDFPPSSHSSSRRCSVNLCFSIDLWRSSLIVPHFPYLVLWYTARTASAIL